MEWVASVRALIHPDHPRQTRECADVIEHPRYLLARDAMIDRDVDRFFRVVIDDRQALEPTTALETVADEIHWRDLVRRQRHLERTTLHRQTTSALAPCHVQAFLAVKSAARASV